MAKFDSKWGPSQPIENLPISVPIELADIPSVVPHYPRHLWEQTLVTRYPSPRTEQYLGSTLADIGGLLVLTRRSLDAGPYLYRFDYMPFRIHSAIGSAEYFGTFKESPDNRHVGTALVIAGSAAPSSLRI